jgi:DNA-binding beta-propeller fold protein YncE
MTSRSANTPGRVMLTSVLWIAGLFFVAAALCGAHATAATFGYVPNANDNTVSVIDTASNSVVATIPVG